MTIDLEKTAEIRRLFFGEHWKRGTIAAQLHVHPDVVTRVIGGLGPSPGTPRPDARVLEPYLPFIEETLARYPRLVSTRICDMLRERGYTGSLRTVRRYVIAARPKPKSEVFLRIETLPGEQAQIDWAHVGEIAVPGGRRPLWAFVMVLAHSRASWGELVVGLDAASLRRSLVRAAAFFGGTTRQWLFDNAKTVVVDRAGDVVRYHESLLDLASRMHAQPRLCTPRKPHEKGGVERAIRYFKERFFAARTFHSIEHGNAQLLEFIETIAHRRPHPRWPERTVADVFADERKRLLPLPDVLPETDLVAPVVSDKTAFIRFDTNRYSVPPTFARATVTLVANDAVVRVLHGDREIAKHERCWGRHQFIEDPAHRAELVQQKRAARDLKGRDRLRDEIPVIETLMQRWVDAGRNLGSMVARTIALLDMYGAAVMRVAVAEMIDRGTHDPGALAILCEQQRGRRRGGAVLVPQFAGHVHERDVVPHDLGGYDD